MRRLIAVLLVISIAAPFARMQNAVPQKETAAEKDARMAWWREARFGLFIHWGLYSEAAGYWQGKKIRGTGEWIMHNAPIAPADYETLTKDFNPVKFDAKEWVRLAKDAGMKYIVITSKHHDGFSMYDSKVSDYDIVDRTPFKRDPMKELAAECEKAGIVFSFYHSIWDWHHPLAKKPEFAKYTLVMKDQLRELLTNYGKIGVLWFDGEWDENWTEEMGKDLYAFCRSIRPGVIINNRVGKGRNDMQGMNKYEGAAGDFCTPEQEIPARGLPGVDWETCMTMNDTWGFRKDDEHWKSEAELIRMIADVASKGGNFLLNVGPTAAGEIPAASVTRLQAIARWMKTNGEAIHGTTASPFAHLPFGRATRKKEKLYLFVFDWPADGKLTIPGLKSEVRAMRWLADPSRAVTRERSGDDIVVDCGKAAPDPVASVLEIEFAGELNVAPWTIRPNIDGSITCLAADAEIVGKTLRVEQKGREPNLGYWMAAADHAEWSFKVRNAGIYDLTLQLACAPEAAGNTAVVHVADQEFSFKVPATADWNTYIAVPVGKVRLEPAAAVTLKLGAVGEVKTALMNLTRITLKATP